MGNSFRLQPGPALYPEMKTPFASDILEVGILVAFAMIAFSFILIIPGIRGWERLWATVRVFVALWIGAVILICNFGYEWYTDSVCVKTQYKAYVFPVGSVQEIEAEVALHIGLRGFNITLKEEGYHACSNTPGSDTDYNENRPFPYEEIDYNEEFRWNTPWAQGRFGFGQFSGAVAQQFRAAELRGQPFPILWVAEYFTLDGEQIRWGRKFRQAGWYAHIFLWLAFATYLLSMLLFIFVIGTGAYFMLITGLVMVLASFSFSIIIINDPKMVFPFADNEGAPVRLDPHFGWSWYLNIVTGILTIFLALVVIMMNYFFPRKIATVFHHSVVEEDEFFQVDEEEEGEGKQGLEEYGVSARGGRGRTTRGRTQRRGLSRYRQTQRKPRSTVRTSTRGQRLHDEIQLQEVPTEK